MNKKRTALLALALVLLAGCASPPPAEPTPEPTPTPTPPPSQLTWLHGFYANASYGQIALCDEMDAVSLGWARLRVDQTGPWVSTTRENGNEWVVPQGAHLATDYLEEHGVACNLCVYASTGGRAVLADGTETDVLTAAISPALREDTAQALVQAAEDYGGLTVDFEGLRDEARREDFTGLMEAIRRRLPQEKRLYVAIPPDHWYHGYDYRALGRICDKVILMVHDYQWVQAPEDRLGTTLTDTPIAPIGLVEEALWSFTDPETGIGDLSKGAIAVAFSAAGVEVDEEGLLLDTKVYNPGTAILESRLAQEDAEKGWSEVYQAPYVYYHDQEGRRYRVWYEDARSVEAKIHLAYDYGITGLSLWRLGTVPQGEGYDVWTSVLKERGS